mmetsp:Transcript_25019/g.43207  ORF Transcript_25019/g.43207 Transcript_25019/m.43207 type:complete len:91 (+) Transcript_25019:398-670(+)
MIVLSVTKCREYPDDFPSISLQLNLSSTPPKKRLLFLKKKPEGWFFSKTRNLHANPKTSCVLKCRHFVHFPLESESNEHEENRTISPRAC